MSLAVKICGATTEGDVQMLAASGADLVGLWHGIPGGGKDLSVPEVTMLAAAARRTERLQPVLVTFINDPNVLLEVLAHTGVQWIQLHAYQPPGVIRALKVGASVHLTVVKVLHVRDGECVERPLIQSYQRAGTDLFLLDRTTENGQVGSTGRRLAGSVVTGLADRMSVPFMLAGGISADNRTDYNAVAEHPLFFGIDVDSGARDADGELQTERVTAIARGWQAVRGTEPTAAASA